MGFHNSKFVLISNSLIRMLSRAYEKAVSFSRQNEARKRSCFFYRIVFRVSEKILEVLGLVVCHGYLRLLYLYFVLVFSE